MEKGELFHIGDNRVEVKIKQFRYSTDNLGYLVYDGGSAMAVDGGAAHRMLEFIRDNNLTLDYVTNNFGRW